MEDARRKDGFWTFITFYLCMCCKIDLA